MATRTYTKKLRAVGEDRTRTALLDAATDAFFAGRGETASLQAIARDAGTTKQTLLRHFGSRQGLLEAAFRRGADEVRDQRLAAPTADIDGAVDNLLDHYEEHGERAIRIGQTDFAQRARQFHYDWIDHAFGRWLDPLPPDERRRVGAALIAICDVHAWWILARDLHLPRPEVHAALTTTIRRLLEEDA